MVTKEECEAFREMAWTFVVEDNKKDLIDLEEKLRRGENPTQSEALLLSAVLCLALGESEYRAGTAVLAG